MLYFGSVPQPAKSLLDRWKIAEALPEFAKRRRAVKDSTPPVRARLPAPLIIDRDISGTRISQDNASRSSVKSTHPAVILKEISSQPAIRPLILICRLLHKSTDSQNAWRKMNTMVVSVVTVGTTKSLGKATYTMSVRVLASCNPQTFRIFSSHGWAEEASLCLNRLSSGKPVCYKS